MVKNNLPTIIGAALVAFCGIIGNVFPAWSAVTSAAATLISLVVTKIAHGMTPPGDQ